MGKTVLYLAVSVDGYLADERGGVSWLAGDGSEPDAPGSYPAFWDTVDAVVMGWTTYHQLVTELSPDRWPYEGRPCYVVTLRKEVDREGIFFWNGELTVLADQLKAEHGGRTAFERGPRRSAVAVHHPHRTGQRRAAVSGAFAGTAAEAGGNGALERDRGFGI